jgi:hypothetical protein
MKKMSGGSVTPASCIAFCRCSDWPYSRAKLLERLRKPAEAEITDFGRFLTILAFLSQLPDTADQHAVLRRRLAFIEQDANFFYDGDRPLRAEEITDPYRRGMRLRGWFASESTRRLLGERQDSPRKMLEDLLIAAAGHGLTDRVRRLLARGVDPEGRETKHPIYRGRSPVQEAALNGHMDIASLRVDVGASWEHDAVDELVATAMSGDRVAVERLLAADPGLRGRAIERCPDQLVRAAEQNRYAAVALLIELGFDVNARSRTAPLHEAAMRGNLPVTRLLLDHGADPNIHDSGYDATPAGWAEHHGQHEAQQLLEALEQPAPATPPSDEADRAVPASQPGAAMRTVAAAFTAVSEGRVDEVGPPERFLVAEVHDGQMTHLRGYATEPEAHRGLHADTPRDGDERPAVSEPHVTSESR